MSHAHAPKLPANAAPSIAGASPPGWFTRAVGNKAEDRYLDVDGNRIHYLRWGRTGKPGLCFVHGGYAHAHWWDWIAPFFADEWTVAALDLGGMGDSGHRPNYSSETYAAEVTSVCKDAGLGVAPIVVGHSFGGLVALKTAAIQGPHLGGVVLADFPLRPPEEERDRARQRAPARRKEIYPTLEAAFRRFKLLPPQPCENEFILDYIARRSLAEVDGGWSWKFDPRIFDGAEYGNPSDDLPRVACRIAVMYGEQSSLFPAAIVAHMTTLLAGRAPMIAVPEAHHHLFLDQPLAFVAALRALLAEWSTPPLEA